MAGNQQAEEPFSKCTGACIQCHNAGKEQPSDYISGASEARKLGSAHANLM